MTSQILNIAIDSLDLRIGAAKPQPTDWLLRAVQGWREQKEAYVIGGNPLVTEIDGIGKFNLRPTGHRFYGTVLMNKEIADVRIMDPEKWGSKQAFQTGQLYINFRSTFLQHEGLPGVRKFVAKLRDLLMAPRRFDEYIKVSCLDMAADVQVSEFFQWDALDQFVSKSRIRDVCIGQDDPLEELFGSSPASDNGGGAKYTDDGNVVIPRVSYEAAQRQFQIQKQGMGPDASLTRVCHNGNPQTLYFGNMKTSALFARLYNKTAEIQRSGKRYMEDFWQALGWDGVSPVARVEFSLKGEFLKSAAVFLPDFSTDDGELNAVADLRDFELCVAALPHLWQYLTRDWLRYCDRGEDSNRSRWETAELWQVVQSAWPDVMPAIRVKPKQRPVLEQLQAQLKGLFLSLCVHSHPKGSTANTPDNVMADVMDWQFSDDFSDRYAERRDQLGRDELSDTWFSVEVRQQHMALGYGS